MLSCSEFLGPESKATLPAFKELQVQSGGAKQGQVPLVGATNARQHITVNGQSSQSCLLFCKWGLGGPEPEAELQCTQPPQEMDSSAAQKAPWDAGH